MKIALAQIDCEVGNVERNCRKFSEFASKATEAGCEVVIFPEMSDTGYVTSTFADCAQPWPGISFNAAKEAATSNSINLVCGISERDGDAIYNSIAVFDCTGQLISKYRKIHLFSVAPVSENVFCSSGCEIVVTEIAGTAWGLSICYDLRFPELYRALMLKGAHVLLNLTAWPASRPTHWEHLTRARAIENQSFFIGVDRVGVDGELKMHGRSRVISPMGDVLVEGSQDREELLIADLNFALVDEFRNKIPAINSRRTDLY